MPKTELEQLRAIVASYGTIRNFSVQNKISWSFISAVLNGQKGIGPKLSSIIRARTEKPNLNPEFKTAIDMGAKSEIANPFSSPDLRKCFDYGRKTKEIGA